MKYPYSTPVSTHLRIAVTLFLCLHFCLVPRHTSAQSTSGSLTGYVYKIINTLPAYGSNVYHDPSPSEYQAWQNLIDSLWLGKINYVSSEAANLSYELLTFYDSNKTYYILQKSQHGPNYWGTYIFKPDYCRKVVIQSPHPRHDYNTGKQGIFVFRNANAAFYCLAGTHRCNQTALSSCSGTTKVCDTVSLPYRISDVAHNDSCIFQATTNALHRLDSQLVFLQLHGFSKLNSDPYVIMSNGSRATPPDDPIAKLKVSLYQTDTVLDFKIAHIDKSWTRLVGFTNVQGRLINGSNDVCSSNADSSYGRFIHLEQEKVRLRQDSTKWEKLAEAVIQTFKCESAGVEFKPQEFGFRIVPNPVTDKAMVYALPQHGVFSLQLFDFAGRHLWQKDNINAIETTIDTRMIPRGVYILKAQTQDGRWGSYRLVVQ